jgi:hypothetical protein
VLDKNKCLTSLKAHVGQKCVFRERRYCRLVMLRSIKVSRGVGRMVSLKLEPVESQGFTAEPNGRFVVSGAFDELRFGLRHVTCPIVSWSVLTDAQAVQQIIEFAAQGPNIRDLVDKFHEAVRPRISDSNVTNG